VIGPAVTGGGIAPPLPLLMIGRGGAAGPTTTPPGPVMAGTGPTAGSLPVGRPGMGRPPTGGVKGAPVEDVEVGELPGWRPASKAHR
jgi:hypothetical protein